MNEKKQSADVGVLIGRFQSPELHQGHLDLLAEVYNRHRKVVVFLGVRPGPKLTRKNPLDFMTRKRMLQEAYPDLTILPLLDAPTDEQWSAKLDERLEEVTDGLSVLLYGSRDSFVPSYKGKHQVIELENSVTISATEVREAAANKVLNTEDFRRGVVYAAFNRWPVSFQAVDIACVRNKDKDPHIILGRKSTDPLGHWRFPGGFVSVTDKSLEQAASRELYEEVEGISVHANPTYLGSCCVDDWRYRGEDDQILTSLFMFDFFHGAPKAADDLAEVRWFPITEDNKHGVLPGHQPLFQLVLDYLNRSKTNAD